MSRYSRASSALRKRTCSDLPSNASEKLRPQLGFRDGNLVEKNGVVQAHGDVDDIFVVRMVGRILGFRELDVDALLQQRV